MLYLADRGWTCTGIDSWAGAVRRARSAAANFALADRISICRADITSEGSLRQMPEPATQPHGAKQPLPAHSDNLQTVLGTQYRLVLNVRFLCRGLAQQLRDWVVPGGYLLFSTFLDDPYATDEV